MNLPGFYEDNFVLNASRTCLSEIHLNKLKSLSDMGKINWESFKRKVSNHNVSGLIYYSLTKYNIANFIPEKVYEFLKNEYYKTAVSNSVFIDELNKLSKIINNKIILLKGADLIQNVYPNVAVRPMYDLDILADKKEAENIWTRLQNFGFKSKGAHNIYKSGVHGKYSNKLPVHLCGLYNEKYLLEIHWNLFIDENMYYLTLKAWDYANQFKDNLYILSNEMSVIYLCFHFYRHSKSSAMLRMLCDINEVIFKNRETLDWDEIKKICFNTGLEYKVKFALTCTSKLLKTPIPVEFILDKIINKNIPLDRFAFREKTEDVLESYKDRVKRIYKLNELFIFLFRTFVPMKEWIIYTYKISPVEKPWKGYLKYWKYLFIKYLLLGKIQLGN